jgi:hypothetical protein
MLEETEKTKVRGIVSRLATKPKWPFEADAQAELGRIATEYAADIDHLMRVVTEISEYWDHCPDGRELREALRRETNANTVSIPPWKSTTCPNNQCDGSGYIEVFSLHSQIANPGGTAFKETSMISREQYDDLSKKIDWRTQMLYTGVKKCACRA